MLSSGFNFSPYHSHSSKIGLFSLFKGKINWSTLLNNTQKTLNIINQAIPVIYQVKPIFNNTKTIFKIMGALKEDDVKTRPRRGINQNLKTINNNPVPLNTSYNNYDSNNTPNFFL